MWLKLLHLPKLQRTLLEFHRLLSLFQDFLLILCFLIHGDDTTILTAACRFFKGYLVMDLGELNLGIVEEAGVDCYGICAIAKGTWISRVVTFTL